MNLGDSGDLSIDKKVETKDGTEVHLKTTDKGTQEIKAYFFEDSKNVKNPSCSKMDDKNWKSTCH